MRSRSSLSPLLGGVVIAPFDAWDASSRAKQAALAEVGGKAGDVERDGDNGGTYEVEVTKADGKEVDVYLDDQYKVVTVDQDNEQKDNE